MSDVADFLLWLFAVVMLWEVGKFWFRWIFA